MTNQSRSIASNYDAIVIGAGIYGCMIALHLKNKLNFKHVAILDKEDTILRRASSRNQYRVHNGYHYPRSFSTANSSHQNYHRFLTEWNEAITTDQKFIYGIAKKNTKINSKQFQSFIKRIGSNLHPFDLKEKDIFNTRMLDKAFYVDEVTYNPAKLSQLIYKKLKDHNIEIFLNHKVNAIWRNENKYISVDTIARNCDSIKFHSGFVINASYAGINLIKGDISGPRAGIKKELAEITYLKLPSVFFNLGITIMDGPFFSILPTHIEGIHSLTHVKYTPHHSWFKEESSLSTDYYFKKYTKTNFHLMLRSASQFIPSLIKAEYQGSVFEIKAILEKHESDDGRPILFETDQKVKNVFHILGSKIDNIYDVLDLISNKISNEIDAW